MKTYVVMSQAGYFFKYDKKNPWANSPDAATQFKDLEVATEVAKAWPLARASVETYYPPRCEEVFFTSDLEPLASALGLPPGASLKLMEAVARSAVRKAQR